MQNKRLRLFFFAAFSAFFVSAAGAQTFTGLKSGAIFTDGGRTQGGAWGDFDNDGDDDLFVVNGHRTALRSANSFYRNDGNGDFVRLDMEPFASDTAAFASAAWGDYDNDGDLDLFVNTFGNPANNNNRLYQNNGDGTFTRVQDGAPVNDSGDSIAGSAWIDIDNDGDLDLFTVNALGDGLNFMYRNEGAQNNYAFTRITSGAIVNDAETSLSCHWADFDNDNDMDVFVVNIGNNSFYINEGDFNFTKVTEGDMVSDGRASVSANWGDYDNDGDFDLFVSNIMIPNSDPANQLFRNNGDGTFVTDTTTELVSTSMETATSNWGDYDNDGDLDMIVDLRRGSNLYYQNDGTGNFVSISAGALTTDVSGFRNHADVDGDGDLDAFAPNGIDGPPLENILYLNDGVEGNWLVVKCVGTQSNRTAIGARIWLKATVNGEEKWQIREIGQNSAYAGHGSLNAHFGLGDAAAADSVIVRWPSGIVDEFTDVAINQYVTVVENGTITSIEENGAETPPADFYLANNYPNPFNPQTTITYHLKKAGQVELTVFSTTGREIRTLMKGFRASGEHKIVWDGRDDSGVRVASGVYLYRLKMGKSVFAVKKMVLAK